MKPHNRMSLSNTLWFTCHVYHTTQACSFVLPAPSALAQSTGHNPKSLSASSAQRALDHMGYKIFLFQFFSQTIYDSESTSALDNQELEQSQHSGLQILSKTVRKKENQDLFKKRFLYTMCEFYLVRLDFSVREYSFKGSVSFWVIT